MNIYLNDREKSYEEKFHMNKETEFKVKSRRNYIFGQWVANQMSLSNEDAERYAQSFVTMLLENPDDTHLIKRVFEDLKKANKSFTLIQLEKELGYAYEDARTQLTSK